MEFSATAGGVSADEEEVFNPRSGKKTYHRHTVRQIQQLEAFFKECPHPDENQRFHLSRELGLEPKQIKFWFQNKRTKKKTQNERADNSLLRAENGRIQSENMAIKEALNNVICPACGGPPFEEDERQYSLRKLQIENAQLKQEHAKITNLVAKYMGKPISNINTSIPPMLGTPFDYLQPTSLSTRRPETSTLDIDLNVVQNPDNFPTTKGVSEVEKALMTHAATSAMEELLRLLRAVDQMWVKSSVDGRNVLHHDSYERMFPRENHFKGSNARFESSKDCGMVPMDALTLVDVFLDPDKWADMFPTLVTEARTILALEDGAVGNRSGALQLMYEEMDILSPLVPPREFYFLRFCRQIEAGLWVIGDVSYDFLRENITPSRCWRLPSGCMIQDMSNGFSKITWIEHVEVDDKIQTHRLYRDVINGGSAYGAERWIATLQRMCERRVFFSADINVPIRENGSGIISQESRRSLMKLAHRMVKNFCATLSMANKLDFHQLSEVNNSGVRISVRNNIETGEPSGKIVNAATSIWLPFQPDVVFNFFCDQITRFQWDILSNGNPIHEITRIPTGAHQGNFMSLLRPFIPTENNVLILQECYHDKSASLLVYAPIDMQAMNIAINGEDSSKFPILPSGIIISGGGRPESGNSINGVSTNSNAGRSHGTLVTLAFQILVATSSSSKEPNMDSLATINTLISSNAQKLKVALNCSNVD